MVFIKKFNRVNEVRFDFPGYYAFSNETCDCECVKQNGTYTLENQIYDRLNGEYIYSLTEDFNQSDTNLDPITLTLSPITLEVEVKVLGEFF